MQTYSVLKVYRWRNATPKRWPFGRGYDKPIHGSCAIYFPGGICTLVLRSERKTHPFLNDAIR